VPQEISFDELIFDIFSPVKYIKSIHPFASSRPNIKASSSLLNLCW
jgi:hypothetical protein